MIHGYTAEQIRAAEQPLLDAGAPLMQHAAFALAGAVGTALAERRGRVSGSTAVLLVGPGNNGGDTLHAGALLARRGVRVLAACTTDSPHAEGLAAMLRVGGRAVRVVAGEPAGQDAGVGPADASVLVAATEPAGPAELTGPGRAAGATGPAGLAGMWAGDVAAEAATADVVLDGLLGIGGHGGLRGVAGLLAGALSAALAGTGAGADAGQVGGPAGAGASAGTNRAGAADGGAPAVVPDRPLLVAVDLPSGIGVDDGTLPEGPVLPADLTVTFGAPKAGLLLPPATRRVGRIVPVDIGLDLSACAPAVRRLDDRDAAALWPVPGPADHKYSRGVLGVVAGTAAYPGAAVLTVSAAALTGVGMIRYLGPDRVVDAVLAARPEVVHGPGRVQAWLLGPGVDPQDMGQAERVRAALDESLTGLLPAVLDAGALVLAPERLEPWIVLTPHAGELAQLLGRYGEEVDRDRVDAEPWRWVRRVQALTGATVLLKGSTTLVAGPEDTCWAQADAPAWLATAGAGDVLAGVLGALLAGSVGRVLDRPGHAAALAATAVLVHGRAADRAVPGGPVTALAVADALPGTVAGLLRAGAQQRHPGRQAR